MIKCTEFELNILKHAYRAMLMTHPEVIKMHGVTVHDKAMIELNKMIDNAAVTADEII